MGANTSLSQAEVEILAGRNARSADGQAAALRPRSAERPGQPRYDFHHAHRVTPELARRLELVHETAARDFAVALAGLVRSNIGVQVAMIDQMTYAELVRRLDNPTCCAVLDARPLATPLVLDVGPAILYPIIDRLLGGVHDSPQPVDRPLTSVERRLASRVINLALEALTRAWQSVLPISFAVTRIETDPRLAAVVPPSELVVAIRFDLKLHQATGAVWLALPLAAIDAVREHIAGGRAAASGLPPVAPAMAQLAAELTRTRIATAEMADLRVGDIITTEKDVRSPLLVTVDGAPCFEAHLGAYRGRKAISIDRRLDDTDPAG